MIPKMRADIRSIQKNFTVKPIYSTADFVQNCFLCAYLTEFIVRDETFATSMQKMAMKTKKVIF